MSLSGSNYDKVRNDYNEQASEYNSLQGMPFGVIEAQLVANAVLRRDVHKGAKVLDLGGGTGMRARQLLELGAERVDLIDMSTEMMATGKQDAEKQLGRELAANLQWFVGNASEPLYGKGGVKGILEKGSYDIVMGNWLFDHISDVKVLERMWRNISEALKMGGLFVGVRACDPRTEAMTTGKYGPTCQEFQEVGDVLYYSSTIPGDPPVHLLNASLKISYSGSTELQTKYGFNQVEIEPPAETEVVQSDPEYWRLWVEKPGFAVQKATKAREVE